MKLLFISFFLLFCQFLFAQKRDTILLIAGHKLIQGGRLKNYKINYEFFSLKDGKEVKTGSLDDQLTVFAQNTNKYALRVCKISFGSNSILDSGLCYLNGLIPIYHRSHQTKKIISLDFNGENVSGFVLDREKPDQDTVLINHKSVFPLFDSYYEDIIAKTIKLKKGLVFKFPGYIYERGGTVWSVGEIKGKERTNSGTGKKLTVWTIIFYEKGLIGETIRITTYKVTKTGRKIISREYKTETGKILMKEQVL